MSIENIVLLSVFLLAVLPVFIQAVRNLSVYRKCRCLGESKVKVSVVIPARNEAEHIAEVLASVLASDHRDIEVLVGDDHSTDGTGAVVKGIIEHDSRVRHVEVPALPAGWGGKMHACWATANEAKGDWLLFIDADVRMEPAAIGKLVGEARASGVKFLSGFPNEITRTLGERVLIPMIFFVLLGFLSLRRMRTQVSPAYAASCGQLMLIERETYEAVGGHLAIQSSCHDGLDMPRNLRKHGFITDLVDVSDIVTCRMYTSSWSTIVGLEKNAKYGLGRPSLIGFFTFMLLVGQVLPWLLPVILPLDNWQVAACLAMGLMGYLIRFAHCKKYGCSWVGALLHPLGVLGLMAIQWVALARHYLGFKSNWKGRKIA